MKGKLGDGARPALLSFGLGLCRASLGHEKTRLQCRVVELTIWDMLSLAFDGAPPAHFKDGQRFQVRVLYFSRR
ncbi:hypothetical protein BC826DRAFT_359847 [Russula brevipes]|nr:hypothetical protein BC826DRAFT_359847 [Russula brevipes]